MVLGDWSTNSTSLKKRKFVSKGVEWFEAHVLLFQLRVFQSKLLVHLVDALRYSTEQEIWFDNKRYSVLFVKCVFNISGQRDYFPF